MAKAAKAAKSGRTTSLPGFRDPENMRTQILPLVLKFLAPKTEEDERAIHGTSLCDAMTSLAKAYTSDENSGKEGAERAEQDDLFWRSVAEALDFIMPHSTADAQSIQTYRDLVMYYCGRLTEASETAKLSPLTELLRAWQKRSSMPSFERTQTWSLRPWFGLASPRGQECFTLFSRPTRKQAETLWRCKGRRRK